MLKHRRTEKRGMSGLYFSHFSPVGQVAAGGPPGLTFLCADMQRENSSSHMNKEAENAWEKATSQAEEAQERARKDLHAAKETAKREVEEAKRARQAESKAKKEAVIAAKENAKREEKEAKERAKRARQAESKAKKEAAIAAKENAKREEKEAKERAGRGEQDRTMVSGETLMPAKKDLGEIPISAEETQESNEKRSPEEVAEMENELPAQITPEDRPTEKEKASLPAAKSTSSELQVGIVKLVIMPTANISQIKKLEQDIQQIPDIQLLLTGGMQDSATIVITAEKPIPLIDILEEIPGVEQVVKKAKNLNITLK